MNFKSNLLRRLSPLGYLLKSIMEEYLSAQETNLNLEISRAYKAVATLFQVASAPLYSPDGIFNELFSAFLIPPWRCLEEMPNKKGIIQSHISENLPLVSNSYVCNNFHVYLSFKPIGLGLDKFLLTD